MINGPQESINETLAQRLKVSYEGDPWHGKSVKAILQISDAPLPLKVLKLLNHMIAWRKYVANILNGALYRIELNTPEDWPPVTQSQEEILDALERSQAELILAIEHFDVDKWHDKLGKTKYTCLDLVQGVIDHDIYHSGQLVQYIRGDV